MPGQNWRNVRRPIVSSLNLAHMLPLSAVWSGEVRNAHLDAPALLVAETQGATPFYLNLHTGDVGHAMIVGPTGAGKSTLLALIAAQFLRYRDAKVVLFDKGRSARAITQAVGGQYFALGDPDSLSLQPLAAIDRAEEMAFAQEWLLDIARREGVTLTPRTKEALWSALTTLADFPRDKRTLTLLVSLVQDQELKQAFMPFLLDGPYGAMLDASGSTWQTADWQCFEMEDLVELPGAIAPTLLAIFHRLEQSFTGAPALLILDEAWLFLDDSLFAAKIKAWLKTLRKKNVAVLFATQSLADIEQSSIAATLIDACPQKIFLPNELKIFALAVVVSFAFAILPNLELSEELTLSEAFTVIGTALTFLMLSIKAPALATSLVSGGPSLGLGAVTQTATTVIGTSAAAWYAAASAGRTAMTGGRAVTGAGRSSGATTRTNAVGSTARATPTPAAGSASASSPSTIAGGTPNRQSNKRIASATRSAMPSDDDGHNDAASNKETRS